MKLIFFTLMFLLAACSTTNGRRVASDLEITEINPNEWTSLTKAEMLCLAATHDLFPFLYTKKINIESRVISHSHPILTLNTRYARAPLKLLSTWLHEEFHWWADSNSASIDRAIAELKFLYPALPTEGVARSEYSTYLHLIICYIEHSSMSHFLGEQKAKDLLIEFATGNVYPWIHTQVLNRKNEIEDIVKRHDLLPPPLN
jgi:hypothetical protein